MMKMSHTRLLVTRFTECFNFYRDVMGFPVLWGDENGTYADFNVGEHKLALFYREPMAVEVGAPKPIPRQEGQDTVCLIFVVEDVDQVYEGLRAKGLQTLNKPHDRPDWGIRCFHFRDPDGNLVEINRDFGVAGE